VVGVLVYAIRDLASSRWHPLGLAVETFVEAWTPERLREVAEDLRRYLASSDLHSCSPRRAR
jgi:hypothetical protein